MSGAMNNDERIQREILKEHAELKQQIQEQTGCNPLDANFQAWIAMFAKEAGEPVTL